MSILSEYWLKGQFQLWNPYSHCGQPQIAIPQPNLFYPPNWLFAWLPFSQAAAWNLVGHQLLIGVGNFLLVASLGWGLAPACLAAVVASLSGYMFSLSTNYTLMASSAWFPLLIFLLRSLKIQTKSRHWYFIAAAFTTALMILTGRPEIFAPGLFLIGLYILVSCLSDCAIDRRLALTQLAWQISALILGVAMTAFFILPSIEWQALSPRAQGLLSKEVFVWSANWYDYICILVAQPLGDLFVHPDKFLNLVAARPGYPPYLIAYVGPVVIALAIVGVFNRGFRVGYMLFAALVFFVVLAAGDNLPIAPYLVANFPKLAIFRFPVKLLFFPLWILSIQAAYGLYLVLAKKSHNLPLLINLILWSALVTCSLAVPFYQQANHIAAPSISTTLFQAQQLIGQSLLSATSLALVISCIIWLRQKGKFGGQALSSIVVGSVFVLLMVHAYSFCNHGAPADFFKQNPSFVERQLSALGEDVSRLKSGVGGRIVTLYFAGLLMPNKLINKDDPYEMYWPASYYQYARQILNPSTHFARRLCSSFGYEGAETADYRTLFVECFNKSHVAAGAKTNAVSVDRPFHRFCQVTSTNYVLGIVDRLQQGKVVETTKLDSELFELLEENRTWNIRIYKVRQPLPRVYMSYDWQNVPESKALDAITHADRSGFDPWRKTLVTVKPDTLVGPSGNAGNGQAQFVVNSADLIKISVNTDKSGLLVVTDHYYPGWLATVDGKPTDIVRANGVLRAVYVPQGQHSVEFAYEPESLRNGFIVAAIALLCLVVLASCLFIKGRRLS